jgi:glycosyltransferase involved in cell wall biosynthesis
LVVTLSESVRTELSLLRGMAAVPMQTLFHPDLCLGKPNRLTPPRPGQPFRLLFLGRIQRYKGLGLLLDAVDLLRAEGFPIEIGVYGAGALDEHRTRLHSIGAEVVNRWLSEAEIGEALGRYHAVALSHIEASQSGVAAAEFGCGVPAIATPVGGLKEQVIDGYTGVLAEQVSAHAFAQAIQRLASSPPLYQQITVNLSMSSSHRSVTAFTEALVRLAVGAQTTDQEARPQGAVPLSVRSKPQAA